MRQKEALVDQTRASGAAANLAHREYTDTLEHPLSLSETMLARRVSAFTVEYCDGLTTHELFEQQAASAAALARAVIAGYPEHLLAYLDAHVCAIDAAVAERLYERHRRQYHAIGGRHVA